MRMQDADRRMTKLHSELLTLSEDVVRLEGVPPAVQEALMIALVRCSTHMDIAVNLLKSGEKLVAATTLPTHNK